ncbi:hypothetical protein XELAEV_18037851mg [Xenopus laevis]|uniref:Kinesin-like protein n=1 Tax=Xenopus laevis TaxID=8355 RepID=A0A974HAL4_XENLA|nr:hypothetical protein XELAEV_18037851mg [Xenopus laevis]
MTMTASSTTEEDNVSVVVRVRPPNQRELEGNHHPVVQVVDHNMLVFDPDEPETTGVFSSLRGNDGTKRKGKDMKFIFDRVFGENSRQQDVFEHTTKEILDGVLNGYNCSVFAYGATGSGKTHTMLGSEVDPSVMYLTMVELYRRIEAIKEEKSCEVLSSYLEVYNEQIQDLLEPRGSLAIREDPQKGVVVQGLSFHQPKSADQLLQMLASGNLNRTQHPTDANASSSRSHAVFQIYVKQQDRTASISQDIRVAKMSLIDLAGSERASSTNAKGERLREGANINRSLLALINVINALADAKTPLVETVGTVMIAAISPSSLSYDDTYNTLKYANRAKEIKLSVKSNVINLDCHISKYAAVCEELKAEVAEMRAKLLFYKMKEQPDDVILNHSPEDKTSPRLEEHSDLRSPEQGSEVHRLSTLSCQSQDCQPAKNNHREWDQTPLNRSLEGENLKNNPCLHEALKDNAAERLVTSLLNFVWKQCEILKRAGLQTPELEDELRQLEYLALGGQKATAEKVTEKERKTEECEMETHEKQKEEVPQSPLVEDVVLDIKEKTIEDPVPPTRKRKPGKRNRGDILPDNSPSLQSPVVPVKRRREAANTPTRAILAVIPSTPEVQVKRPRKSSIPSKCRFSLRSSLNLLPRNTNDSNVQPSSDCTPKQVTQTANIQSHTVTRSRVPLGISAIQNCASVPASALVPRDLNTTFDLSEEGCFISKLDKTVNFGTSDFPGWENVPIHNIDNNFGKSSDVAVFTMKGLSVKHMNANQMASAAKSYSHKRRQSSSSSICRIGLAQSRIARLQMSTVKKSQKQSTISENISCSPRGQSGKRTGKGTVAFGMSLSAVPMTRFSQYAVFKL